MLHKLPIEGEWREFTDERIEEIRRDGGEGSADALLGYLIDYEKNPLRYFRPHGVPWHARVKKYAGGKIVLPPSEYPREYQNDGVAFQNDWSNDYVMLKAPRKTGKSIAGAAKVGYFMLKSSPDWECFSGKGGWLTKHRPWDGPKIAIVASFSWPNVAELWEAYREVWPRYELGPYAKDWGKFPGETGRARNMSFGDGRYKWFEPAVSGGRVIFLCYGQQQHVWENFKGNILHEDEQGPTEKLNAFEDGSRTMGDYTPVIFTWSGFCLPERPDTGAAGPMAAIWHGRMRRGTKTISRYNMDVPSTPDAIIGPKKKRELYDLYANPEIERDRKTERRGLAVYFPGDEPGAGLVFDADVWQREIHVINPLWADDKAPREWTKCRSIDYADRGVTCCAWFAVGAVRRWFDRKLVLVAVLYRVLYERNLTVAAAVQKIVSMSHNERRVIDRETDEDSGNTYDVYEEVQSGEQFYMDLIDSRIAKNRQQGQTIDELFRRHGMQDIVSASGDRNEVQIPALKDKLRIAWSIPHPWRKNEDGTPFKGCPQLFFFDGRGTGPAIDELEMMPSDEDGPSVIDKKFAHDFIDAAKYWASDDTPYMGPPIAPRRECEEPERELTPFTNV